MADKITTQRFDKHLPSDIIHEILSRLPVKSLLLFKCVCKTWCDLSKNPNFIEKHNTHSAPNPYYLHFSDFNNHPSGYVLRYRMLHLNGTFDKTTDICIYHEGSFRQTFSGSRSLVIGISRGLVCLLCRRDNYSGQRDVFLFNPATRQCRKLSDCMLKWYGDGEYRLPNQLLFTGLEFNSDFNFSLLAVHRRTYEYRRVNVWVKIYDINTGNWRDMLNLKIRDVNSLLPSNIISDFTYKRVMPILLKGVFYWKTVVSSSTDFSECQLACLDIYNATYDEITIPETLANNRADTSKLIDLNGELALIHHSRQDIMVEFWVLNESERNWTKKFMIEDSPICKGFHKLVGFWGNNELLVQNHSNCSKLELLLCDVNSGKTNTFYLPGHGVDGVPYIYAESLVSPFGSHELPKLIYPWLSKSFPFIS